MKRYKRIYPKRIKTIKVNRSKLKVNLAPEEFNKLTQTLSFEVNEDICIATVKVEGPHSFTGDIIYDIVLTRDVLEDGTVVISDLDFPQGIYTERELLNFFVVLKKLVLNNKGELLLDVYDKPRSYIEHYKDGKRLHTVKVSLYIQESYVEHIAQIFNEIVGDKVSLEDCEKFKDALRKLSA